MAPKKQGILANARELLASLERFLAYAWKQKLWRLAAGAFIVSVPFVVKFYLAVPGELASIERNAVEFDVMTQDYDNILQAFGIMSDTWPIYISAIDTLSTTLSSAVEQQVKPEMLEEAVKITSDAQLQFALATGTLKGMTFHDPRYGRFVDATMSDLSKRDEILSTIQELYLVMLSGDATKTQEHVNALRLHAPRYLEYNATAMERVENFRVQFEAIHAENMIMIAEKTSELRVFTLKFYLTVPLLIYSAAFVTVGYRTWVRRRSKGLDQPPFEGP